MNLLVTESAAIVYIYSVVSLGFLVAGKPIGEGFFKASALVTLIMVGEGWY